MSISDEAVQVTIGRAEALVLFEMLADSYSQPCLQIGSAAEKLALIRLQGALEKSLVEPFMPEYRALIDEARSLLTNEGASVSLMVGQ